jgi:hypothetical protein
MRGWLLQAPSTRFFALNLAYLDGIAGERQSSLRNRQGGIA